MNATLIAKLRVNVKSLAAEARIIRRETDRARDPETKNSLALHRTGRLRSEARHAQLALALARRRSYRSVEPTSKTEPQWDRILTKIQQLTYSREARAAAEVLLLEWKAEFHSMRRSA